MGDIVIVDDIVCDIALVVQAGTKFMGPTRELVVRVTSQVTACCHCLRWTWDLGPTWDTAGGTEDG